MPRLSQPERDRAIGMLQAGRDRRAVARLLGVHHSTVVHLEQRYNTTSADRPRAGRPRVTTAAQDRANRTVPDYWAINVKDICGIQTHTFDFTKFGQKL